MRRAAMITLCGLGLFVPGAARAAGGPVPAVVGGSGVGVSHSPFNVVALPAGASTLVERVDRRSGTVENFGLVRGQFGVPGATYDGVNTGLSADARTLVLAGTAGGPGTSPTQLVVLDGVRLRERARFVLPGYSSVDAISPTGRWLYLIHYKSTNLTNYEVRAYDVKHRRLLANPVVDPRAPGEKMQGLPATRAMSADGRWAYTLYGGNRTPFVHALDTETRAAFCVDVPILGANAAMSAKLALGLGPALRIEENGTPVALIDIRTFVVSRPPTAQQPLAARSGAPGHGGGGLPWELGIVPLAGLIALALLARRRRRSHVARAPLADVR